MSTGVKPLGLLLGVGTAGAGLGQEQLQQALPYTIFGVPLGELALIVGILGVVGNLLLHYLSYKRGSKEDEQKGKSDLP